MVRVPRWHSAIRSPDGGSGVPVGVGVAVGGVGVPGTVVGGVGVAGVGVVGIGVVGVGLGGVGVPGKVVGGVGVAGVGVTGVAVAGVGVVEVGGVGVGVGPASATEATHMEIIKPVRAVIGFIFARIVFLARSRGDPLSERSLSPGGRRVVSGLELYHSASLVWAKCASGLAGGASDAAKRALDRPHPPTVNALAAAVCASLPTWHIGVAPADRRSKWLL